MAHAAKKRPPIDIIISWGDAGRATFFEDDKIHGGAYLCVVLFRLCVNESDEKLVLLRPVAVSSQSQYSDYTLKENGIHLAVRM